MIRTEPVADVQLLAPLSATERAEVLAAAVTRRFRRGETVMREGEPGESLHLVRSGTLAVRVSTPAGATATLTVISAGSSFGELALLGAGHVRTATVIALESAETLVLTRSAFDALRRSHPAVERVVTEALAQRVQELSSALLEALYVPVDRRIVARLVDLGRIYGGVPGTARSPFPSPRTTWPGWPARPGRRPTRCCSGLPTRACCASAAGAWSWSTSSRCGPGPRRGATTRTRLPGSYRSRPSISSSIAW